MKNPMVILLAIFTSAPGAAGAGDELAKSLRTVLAAKSYHFSLRTAASDPVVEAKFQKGVPLYIQADRIDFFRQGDILVYKQGDTWQRTRTGTLSDPLRILGASAKARAVRLPHEDLAVLGKALVNVKKNEAMLTGELGVEAAKKLAPIENRDLARAGAAKLWLNADGQLVKYEITIRIQGRLGNADVDGFVTRTVTVGGVGMTKIDVPAGAKKALK